MATLVIAADTQTTRARSPKEKHEDLMKPSDAVYEPSRRTVQFLEKQQICPKLTGI
jgi:hypothetical protein